MSARLIRSVLVFFVAGAALGAALVLAGPVPFVRGLGMVTLALALVGMLIQLYALHEFAPDAYAELRARVIGRMQPARPVVSGAVRTA